MYGNYHGNFDSVLRALGNFSGRGSGNSALIRNSKSEVIVAEITGV